MNTGVARMKKLAINKSFTLMESGPVVLVTTNDGSKNNIMTMLNRIRHR